jgi:hypothetical protein
VVFMALNFSEFILAGYLALRTRRRSLTAITS